jgi:hypothetical protein
MRRLLGLGVILSSGLIAACGSSSSPSGGTGGGGGVAGVGGKSGAGGKGGGTAGTTGQGGAAGQAPGGAGGHASAGTGGQPAGGAGGQPAGGAGGQPAGGAGGQPAGGAGGQSLGGAGGQSLGGATGSCLDPAAFAPAFTIADSTFCAVAIYTAPESIGYQAPTWGSHGGPLVAQVGATPTAVTFERWTAPAGSTGTMILGLGSIAGALSTGTFLGAQALDLPFFAWTAISWTNPFPDSTGQFEMYSADSIHARYSVNGPYGMAVVPAASSLGRLLYTGLSPLGMQTTSVAGLYEADACSSPAEDLGTGTGCSASALVAAWGDSPGPVVTDANNDVFAVMTSVANGTQEARGFLASSVARGSAATAGTILFSMDGFAGSLAALTPTATDPGLVVFQPFDSTTFAPLPVVEQKFTTSGALAAMGTPSTFLNVPPAQTQGLSVLVDGSQRLWVAVSKPSSTMYVVLARRT